jgi:hypothetical protein
MAAAEKGASMELIKRHPTTHAQYLLTYVGDSGEGKAVYWVSHG